VWPKLKVIYARKSWRAKMPEHRKLYEIYIRACRSKWTNGELNEEGDTPMTLVDCVWDF